MRPVGTIQPNSNPWKTCKLPQEGVGRRVMIMLNTEEQGTAVIPVEVVGLR